MKIDDSYMGSAIAVLKKIADDEDARACENTAKNLPETAAYFSGIANGLRAAAGTIEDLLKRARADELGRAEAAADNEIAYRQAEAFSRHDNYVARGEACADPTCYHNQPHGEDVPF